MNSYLERVVNWLRAGYPMGVPDQDFVPLLAILKRRLSEDEIHDLGAELVRRGFIPADKIDVGVGITRVTEELPSDEEMVRVSQLLSDAGWPVDDPHLGRDR